MGSTSDYLEADSSDTAGSCVHERSSAGFVLFATAWSVYSLMHQALTYGSWLRFDDIDKFAMNALPFILAIFVLGRPSSLVRFVLLLLSVVALKIWQMPYMGNHLFFTLCVTLSMLLVIGWRAMVPERGPMGAGKPLAASAFDLFAPVLRLEIIVLYFWVVVHKLNWDYLNPEVSCAWELYLGVIDFMQVRFGIPLPNWHWLAYPGLYGALLAEAAIPLLLAFRKTRKLGIFFGLAFHLMLSFHQNEYIASFSLMLYAAYILFLPGAVWVGVVHRWQSGLVGGWFAKSGWRMSAAIVAAIALYSGVIVALAATNTGLSKASIIDTLHQYSDPVFFTLWLGWAAICVAVFLRWCRRAWAAEDLGWARLPVAFYLLPFLIWLNGWSPYVGLKTHHCFAMFSNLRTEGGQTNHLFIPASIRVVPYQDEAVTVLASDMAQLPVTPEGERMTWFEFRRKIHAAQPGTTVTYQRDREASVTLRAQDIAAHPELAAPAYWLRKTQLYKAIPMDDEPCACRH